MRTRSFFTICFLQFGISQAQIITTIAGNGTVGYSGNGGQATMAQLSGPHSVATDPAGNFYIVDGNNSCVRKVNTSGIITTVVGTSAPGFYGDGGPAVSAELNGPIGIAFDAWGNMYIADAGNLRIRKVNISGIITTFAGNGTWGHNGDGGPAIAAQFKVPSFIATDNNGNIYISDASDCCIRKVNTSGTISTVAGNTISFYSGDGGPATAASLAEPEGLAVDVTGNIYIADPGVSVIRKVDTNGIITTIAGTSFPGYSGDGGPATMAQLYAPFGISLDVAGSLYIADSWNHCIRKINTSGIISTIAGSGLQGFGGDGGLSTLARLNVPLAIALDANSCNLYIVDNGNDRIRRVSNATVSLTVNSPSVCVGATATLSVNGATTYNWVPSTYLNTSTGGTVSSTSTASITYTVTGITNWCASTATVFLTVNPLPTLTVNSPTICVGSTSVLTASGANAYTWSPSNSLNNDTGVAVISTPSVSTSYSIMDNNGCVSSNAFIVVNSLPIVSISSVAPSCVPLCTTFTSTSSPIAKNYTWNFGNGQTSFILNSFSSSFTTSTCFSVSGTYTVNLNVTDTNNCVGTASTMVVSYPLPTTDFNYTPQPVTILSPQVHFINQSSDSINNYSWSFGDINNNMDTSSLKNPTHIYPATGTYNVILTATSPKGCSASVTKLIMIEDYVLYVPNIFTPNGDNINDDFFIKGVDLYDFNCKIFDRWGELIYEWSDISGGWDGKNRSGLNCNDGVYYYLVSYTTNDKKIVNRNGYLQLER